MQRWILGFLTWNKKYSTKSWTIQQLIRLWPSLDRVEAWQTWTRFICFLWLCQWLSVHRNTAGRSWCVTLGPSCSISLCWASLLHAYLLRYVRYVYFNLVLMQRCILGFLTWNKNNQQNLERFNNWSASGLAWKEWRHGKILGQDSSAFCGCASEWVSIETRRGVRNVWLWAHLVA